MYAAILIEQFIHSFGKIDSKEALHSKGLDLVWIVVLEKFYNPHDGSYNSKMTMPSGLFYMDENDNIKGTMTLHKRQ